MGTFIIRPTSLASGGDPLFETGSDNPDQGFWSITGLPAATILQAMNNLTNSLALAASAQAFDTITGFGDTLRFLFTGDCIFLDGSLTPISFASLPSGFLALTAEAIINTPIITGDSDIDLVFYFLQHLEVDEGLFNTNPFPYTDPIPSMLDIVSNGIGFRVNMQSVDFPHTVSVSSLFNLRIQGTYTAVSFSWTLTSPDNPVKYGSKVTIHPDPDDPTQPPLTDITSIEIHWNDGEDHTLIVPSWDIIFFMFNLVVFYIPYGLEDFTGPIDIVANVVSVEFSGSVSLGTLDILFENVSGIYQLTPGVKHDTLYSDSRDGTTIDVAIPSPFGKTGFVGG